MVILCNEMTPTTSKAATNMATAVVFPFKKLILEINRKHNSNKEKILPTKSAGCCD